MNDLGSINPKINILSGLMSCPLSAECIIWGIK